MKMAYLHEILANRKVNLINLICEEHFGWKFEFERRFLWKER